MKTSKIYLGIIAATSLFWLNSCTKDFGSINTNPETNLTAPPEGIFAHGCLGMNGGDFETFYDYYRQIMPWMQLDANAGGNPAGFTDPSGNSNYRYGYLYSRVGPYFEDVRHIIDGMPADQKAKYAYERAISYIPEIYYVWYVSDANGDIAYTQAFKARYGGTATPKYDTQQALFDTLDLQLKNVIAVLKSQQSAPQASYGNSDLYYGGSVSAWIKAAASLRLKIAMRLMNREPDKLKAIANEVISSGDLMGSNGDNWVFVARNGYTGPGGGSNWNPTTFKAPKPMVDFMWNNSDPRLSIFFQKNSYDSATYALAQQQGVLDPNTPWNPRQYVGMPVSPDDVKSASGKRFISFNHVQEGNSSVALDTTSFIQYRLWQAEYPDSKGAQGTGNTVFVYLTYPDVCFMRAELAAAGITSESAQQWYNAGVTASIKMYDHLGNLAKVFGYSPVTDAQISAYLSNPVIQYNASKALEQIACQEFINYYKQPNEAWALWKRTGMPNATTDLQRPDFSSGGAVLPIPRRAQFNLPIKGQANYDNIMAALTHMESDPGYGQGPSDVYGRVWWDSK